jgi:hypothetical protein
LVEVVFVHPPSVSDYTWLNAPEVILPMPALVAGELSEVQLVDWLKQST